MWNLKNLKTRKESDTVKHVKSNININSKNSIIKSTAHIEKNIFCRRNIDLSGKKYELDDPDDYQFFNINESTIQDCGQYFHRSKEDCEYKRNFLPGKNGEDELTLQRQKI